MTKGETGKPLRILAVMNLPWDARLGAARIWMELKKEWEQTGHQVERFCLEDAFSGPEKSRLRSAWRQLRFPAKAATYIRQNSDRFDVIDSVVGCLPFAKGSLKFKGLLVARSVGLYRLYEQFRKRSLVLWPDQPKGRWLGRPLHKFLAWQLRRWSERAVTQCDLLNLPNEDERIELERDPQIHAPIMVQPNGLTNEFRTALSDAATPAQERLSHPVICFIGMWILRKGSRDWPKIIAAVRRRRPAVRFLFLGTMFEESLVRHELGPVDNLECRVTFGEAELPSLLAPCTLALFPSYIEGFGLAVVEQLAAGLPVVAYDVPGPRQILDAQRARLLVPAGDVSALAERALEILKLTVSDYEKLTVDCRQIAERYRWDKIAGDTIERYRQELNSLGKR